MGDWVQPAGAKFRFPARYLSGSLGCECKFRLSNAVRVQSLQRFDHDALDNPWSENYEFIRLPHLLNVQHYLPMSLISRQGNIKGLKKGLQKF